MHHAIAALFYGCVSGGFLSCASHSQCPGDAGAAQRASTGRSGESGDARPNDSRASGLHGAAKKTASRDSGLHGAAIPNASRDSGLHGAAKNSATRDSGIAGEAKKSEYCKVVTVQAAPILTPGNLPKTPALCADDYRSPKDLGKILCGELKEISGIAASRRHQGVFWVHNDSGDSARVFGIDMFGQIRAEVRFDALQFKDLEDLAVGPCPAGIEAQICLWLADTGNNIRPRRETLWLYVLPEPDLGELTLPKTALQAYAIRYPGGEKIDCEAIAVAPDARPYFFEKVDGPSFRLFTAAALGTDGPNELTTVTALESPGLGIKYGRMVTGADLHPSGERLLLRLYTGIFEYALPHGLSGLNAADLRFSFLGPLSEHQGEACAYDASGRNLVTLSEGAAQTLHFYTCVE